jgi:predicted nucleotidyltransferase
MNTNEQAAVLKLKQELTKVLNLVDIRVFGSKARGEKSSDSDIDVMIEVENYSPEIESLIDDLVFEINLSHGCLISVLIFGKEELEEGPLRESPIYRAITKEGISV